MLTEQVIQDIILRALDTLNSENSVDRQITVSADTQLFGTNAALDSLSLVSVIVDVETELSTEAGRPISLTDDRAMARDIPPFTDVRTLTAYSLELLAEPAL